MNSAALDVITIGECMVQLIAEQAGPLSEVTHFTKGIAGAETNVAIGLARLGHRVGWVSRLGNDSFGEHIRHCMAQEQVDCASVTADPQRSTGMMLKSRTLDGSDPTTEYHRKGSAASALSLADFDPQRFLAARHLHVTGIPPALSDAADELIAHSIRFMRQNGRTVSFDPNLRPRLWPTREHMVARINRLAPLAHWVLPGLEEGRILTGMHTPADIAAFYLQAGAEHVVIKLGAAGAYHQGAAESGTVPGVKVAHVVDTVGAGDGFAVGVISARLEGLGWPAALARGNWVGAQALQAVGDMDGLPYRAQLPG